MVYGAELYVDYRGSCEDLLELVRSHLDGVVVPVNNIESATLEVSVRPNPDPDPTLSFGRYPFYLEVELPGQATSHHEALSHFEGLLSFLWSKSMTVVTVADFAEDLPNHGRNDDEAGNRV